ncbi:MAG: hypothetical protein IPK19_08455 [Chloroflexi bacterium]|nr:hypothetical protein [Chloroflexota bacterium]
MRRALLLVVPAGLLAILILLSRTIPDWRHPVLSGGPGQTLYVATFAPEAQDEFNRDWDQFGGRLSSTIEGGALHIRVDELEDGTYSAAAPHFGDFDVTVRAAAIEGPEDNGFGILFRFQDQDNNNPTDDSYYFFEISSDGYYRVSRVVDGVEEEVSTWIDTPLVNTGIGAENTLRVRAEGNAFAFFINGERISLCIPDSPDAISTYSGGECFEGSMVDTLQDGSIATGQIGVGAKSFMTDSGVVVAFDDLVVTMPSAETVSAGV